MNGLARYVHLYHLPLFACASVSAWTFYGWARRTSGGRAMLGIRVCGLTVKVIFPHRHAIPGRPS